MKHPDDDNELFNRLEAEMGDGPLHITDSSSTRDLDLPDLSGEVVDLDKARSARTGSADPTTRPGADRAADSTPVSRVPSRATRPRAGWSTTRP